MRKESLDFLKQLLITPSPSGFEERVQAVCREYVAPFVDEVYKDVHGNQYAVRNKSAPLRVMLAGHVDEIGLMVNTIDEKGFIGFVPIGGVDAATLPGQRLLVHGRKGPVPGVIGRKAIHLIPPDDRKKFTDFHEMWIDIGAKDKKDAEKLVGIGDPVTIDVGYLELRDNKVVARALDDRIGAFVCIEAMRLLEKRKIEVAVYCVTTVQEEIGLRGATTSAYGCNPHAGIAVDVAWATDHPRGDGDRYGHTKINGGPILDRGPNINPVVHAGLVRTAEKHKIPLQHRASPRATGTDANAMQLSRDGVATAIVGIPNRYMHTPVELVSLKDVENAARLIAEWVCTLKRDAAFIP
ncbi:MAG TPA: M42 family metallopeptidase [Candidatus Hydrogenedentes bacterium]|nr:M42 family metallopeptidase [Candidatus Hydrogenedentota bacterium]HNT86807.1 M42 family metallopeptidase [Candidatus Hydrogenedentota bacterium]